MSAKRSSTSAKKSVDPETFDTRDVVLGKIRGFPPWPGMIVDPASVPKAVAKERPAGKKSAVYVVRFFPAGDYAWLHPKEIKKLSEEDIQGYMNDAAKKQGDLMEGYKSALDPSAWEEEHAANPPAAKKRKSKSKSKKRDGDDEEDELDADDAAEEEAAEEEEPEDTGKKRKRAAPEKEKKTKAPAAAKNGAAAKKGGKARKSKATVESEDDAAADGDAGEDGGEEGDEPATKKAKVTEGEANLESDPEALKVREWRHKLQKTFLSSNKSLPKDDEMPAVDTLFTTVEGYQNMNIDYLTFSKIGKVMRHIHLLEPHKVPRDDEFKFRDRAKALVDKWHAILNANKAPEAAVTEGTAKMDLNGTDAVAEEGDVAEGDLTVMDATMDES